MLTKQAWSIKNLLYGQKDNFFLQYQHGHLTHVPDTDNVKQKKNNHETIPNRYQIRTQNLLRLVYLQFQPYNKSLLVTSTITGDKIQ